MNNFTEFPIKTIYVMKKAMQGDLIALKEKLNQGVEETDE